MINKINEENNNMVISMEKEQKTLEYQEAMNADVHNISNLFFGDQYAKLLIFHLLQQHNFLCQDFKTNVKKIKQTSVPTI